MRGSALQLDELLRGAGEAHLTIFLVTMGTGASGEQMCRTVAGQFPSVKVGVQVVAGVLPHRLEGVVAAVARVGGVIAHTFVEDGVRAQIVRIAEAHLVPCVDLVSRMLRMVADRLGCPPLGHSGVYRVNCAWYSQLSEAIHYAIKHDDGARPEEWAEADCLILGVSRAGKSPLSMFLATMGFKVANYPICPGVDIPEEISLVPRGRCFGLVIDPEVLAAHRAHRAVAEACRKGLEGLQAYTDLPAVFEETEAVEKYFKQKRITRVDVTGQTVQATAKKVIRILHSRYDDEESDEGDADGADHGKPVRCPRFQGYEDLNGSLSPSRSLTTASLTLYVVTTGCGFSAERLVSNVAGQFPDVHINVENRSYCLEGDLPGIVAEVAEQRGVIAHTLVVRSMRTALEDLCEAREVPCVDLYGPLLDTVAQNLGLPPSEQRGAYQCWSAEYFHFVKAVEFALDHDEGAFPSGWRHVDALLLGTPNTGKSALSVFLGTLGKKVANLTLAPDVPLPAEFELVDRRRVFGLVSQTARRHATSTAEGRRRFEEAEAALARLGVQTIDCTSRPVEQTANLILKALDAAFGPKEDVPAHTPAPCPSWAW